MASVGCPLLHPPPESTGPSQLFSVAGGTPWYGLTTVHISIHLPRDILVVFSFEQSCCEHSCKGNKEATPQNVEAPQLMSKGLTTRAHLALQPQGLLLTEHLPVLCEQRRDGTCVHAAAHAGRSGTLAKAPAPTTGVTAAERRQCPAHLGPRAQPAPGTRSGVRKDLALGT